MKIIEPITISDAMFTSSTVSEDDYDAWSDATEYDPDDYVIIVATHLVWKCILTNTNKPPADNIYDGDADPVTGYWTLIGSTNKWKIFDGKSKDYCEDSAVITIVITPGTLFNAIGFVNVIADTISVSVSDPIAGTVYSETVNMKDLSGIEYFYDWFFGSISNIEDAVLLNLPAYSSGIITISINNGTDDVSVGEIVIGKIATIGEAVYGTGLSIEDYSIKEIDPDIGSIDIEEGTFSENVSYEVSMASNRVYYAKKILSKYRAAGIIYIGEENTPETIVFAFLKDFSIILQNFNRSECSLEVEELTS